MVISKLFNKSILNNKKVKIYWFVLLAFIALTPYFFTILFTPISLDSSYYLSVVERIREGLIPYRDFSLGYTPIFFYLTLIFKNAFSIGINYGYDLGFHFCFQIFISFLLYKIAFELLRRKDYSYYVAIFNLLISYWIVQYEFILEIPSLMWGFLAIYLAIKYKGKTTLFILIGSIASLSFLTKQYGIGFFFLILYLIIFNSNKWKQLFYFLIGYAIPVIIVVICLPEITNVFLGDGYGNQEFDKSTVLILIGICKRIGDASIYFLYRVPVLLYGIALFSFIPIKQRKYAGLLLFGIAGFMFQFIFAGFNHYMLYIIPFVSLYIFMVLNNIKKNKIIFGTYVFILLVVFAFSILKNYNRALAFDHKLRDKQFLLAEKIKKLIEPGKSLYISDVRLVDLYYPINVKPTNMTYSFGYSLSEKTHYKQIHDADYILTYEIPDSLNFNYLNSIRIKKYLREIPDKTIIEKQLSYDNVLNKNLEYKIILYKNKH